MVGPLRSVRPAIHQEPMSNNPRRAKSPLPAHRQATPPTTEDLEQILLSHLRRVDSDNDPALTVRGWSEFAPAHPLPRDSSPGFVEPEESGTFGPPPMTSVGTLRVLPRTSELPPPQKLPTDAPRTRSAMPSVIISDPPPGPRSEIRDLERYANNDDVEALPVTAPSPRSSRDLADTIPPTRPRAGPKLGRQLTTMLLAATLFAVGAASYRLFPHSWWHQVCQSAQAESQAWWQRLVR